MRRVPAPRGQDRFPFRAFGAMLPPTGNGGTPMAYEAGDYETIILERRGQVAVLTLNRPDRLNAISIALREEVVQAVAAVRADDEARALVLTGAGRGFCAGADLLGTGP